MSHARSDASRLRVVWWALLGAALASRLLIVFLQQGLRGYDAWGHASYVLFLDLYRSVPYADQGWSYFHPPLHYVLGWLMAQLGSATVLVRGLALLGSAESLGIALLTAALVRRALPDRPYLPLLAFAAVAFLPVHVYASPMPGNEMTATFFGSAAIVVFLANASRTRASLALDASSGALVGLALLSKFSGFIPLLAIAATLGFQLVRGVLPARQLGARLAAIAGVAIVLAGPYYARGALEYGTLFRMNRDYPLTARVEQEQPPGERSWSDLVRLSPRLMVDPDPKADHLLHSVWGSVYVHMWAGETPGNAWARALAFAGLIPTTLFFVGLARSLQRSWRDPRDSVDVTLVFLACGGLAAFAIFAWRVPIWTALKASYLLNLSLAYGFFVARAVADPPRVARGVVRLLGPIAIALAALLAVVAITLDVARFQRDENAPMAMLHAHFGDYDVAREVLLRENAVAIDPTRALRPGWGAVTRETLSAVELLAGRPDVAYQGYVATAFLPIRDSPHLTSATAPHRLSRAAAAAALAGERSQAMKMLDQALADGPLAEPLVNRGALRALAGRLRGAEADLTRAIELNSDLAPAWSNLAWVQARAGRAGLAQRSRDAAARAAGRPPRGFPYGVGNGFHLNEQRFMLVLRGNGLELYRPPRSRSPQ